MAVKRRTKKKGRKGGAIDPVLAVAGVGGIAAAAALPLLFSSSEGKPVDVVSSPVRNIAQSAANESARNRSAAYFNRSRNVRNYSAPRNYRGLPSVGARPADVVPSVGARPDLPGLVAGLVAPEAQGLVMNADTKFRTTTDRMKKKDDENNRNRKDTLNPPTTIDPSELIFKDPLDEQPVELRKTLSDGNCLFSAVFRALSDSRLLENIKNCNQTLDISSEQPFIKSLRNLVADTVNLDEMFDHYNSLHKATNKNSKNTLQRYLSDPSGLDPGQKKIIKQFILIDEPDKNAFDTAYKDYIRTDKNFSSDIEYLGIETLLQKCNIKLVVLSKKVDTLPVMKNGMRVIYLFNDGNWGGGVHFEYYAFRSSVYDGIQTTTRPASIIRMFPESDKNNNDGSQPTGKRASVIINPLYNKKAGRVNTRNPFYTGSNPIGNTRRKRGLGERFLNRMRKYELIEGGTRRTRNRKYK